MSAISKAVQLLRHEAYSLKAAHSLLGDWCGDPAEADYDEMVAIADAAIAERDAMLVALEAIVSTCSVRIDDPRIAHFDAARAAIASATGGG